MSKRFTYSYDGLTFNSIRALAAYAGINEKTLTARLQRGIPIEKACENKNFRCRYFEIDNTPKSIRQICSENKKNEELVRNRLKYGFSLDKALNSPKKITKQGKPVVVKGILYNSLAEAIRKHNLLHKESSIRRLISKGAEPDKVFDMYIG